MITNHGKGNPELVNLPRKINIGLSTTRDDFAHTHINDVGLYAAKDPETGKVGFLTLDVLLPNMQVGSFACQVCYEHVSSIHAHRNGIRDLLCSMVLFTRPVSTV